MANLYSKTTGNWTTLGTFNTLANGTGVDTVPTNAYDVVIQSGHTVTLNSTSCAAKSCTVNSGGTLTASTSASSTLTLENDLVNDGTVNLDVSSDITVVCSILTNNANSSGSGTLPSQGAASPAPSLGGCFLTRTNTGALTLKGAVRKRWTTLSAQASSGASSATVSDATGWRQGDVVVLGSTSTTQTAFDLMTLSGSYSNGSTTLAFTANLSNTHASGGYVINLTSNLIVGPVASGRSGNFAIYNPTTSTSSTSKTLSHVQFNYLKTSSLSVNTNANVPFFISQNDTTDTGWQSFDSCAFNDFTSTGTVGMYLYANATAITRTNNVFHLPSFGSVSALYTPSGVVVGYYLNAGCLMGTDTDMVVTRTTGPVFCPGVSSAYSLIRPKVTGSHTGIFTFKNPGIFSIEDPDMQGGTNFCISEFGQIYMTATTSTSANIGGKAAWTTMFNQVTYSTTLGGTSYNISMTDTNIQSGGTFLSAGTVPMDDSTTLTLVNKNADVTLQEIWKPYGNIKRSTTNKRSTSSVALNPTTAGKNLTYTVSIPCANGATIRIIGYCQVDSSFYNSGTWTAPTATLSGLGATPVTFTATSSASGAWQAIDISITNSSGADGNFTLTFTANKLGAGNTGNVYFDGIPTNSPFVTKARNYGFVFDQTVPNVTTNITISASEATALGYASAFTMTGGTSTTSTAIIGNTTFQKLYDYTQAWSCTTANLGYAIPVTGAGLAGSPVLFAQGTITISTTKVLNGSGSINMGSYTLTTETASAQSYTFTGGAWSQATTVPTISGGTLALSGEGTWVLNALGSPIITFAPTAGSVTYAMGDSTFGGTVDLRNTSATRAITVELPSGTTYTTANNTGAAITVNTPQLYQSVTISGATAGSRIQIYDTTSSTELYNGTPSFPYTWTDGSPASASRAIRLRCAYQSGVTAKNFIDVNIGTCGTTSSDKDISYLVNQEDDYTYNLNAINGSTVTGITITAGPNRVSFNIGGGSVTNASIYAYQVYWQATSTGIANETAFISSSDPANYIYTDFLWKNTNSSVPLSITGGWARDSVTGLTETLFDTTGYPVFAAANASLLVTTGSGPLTSGQEAQLATAASSSTAAANQTANLTFSGTSVQADIRKVLGTAIQAGSNSTASIGY